MAIIAGRWFRHVKGFLIGRPLSFGEEAFGMDQYEAVVSMLRQYEVPIGYGVDIGHLPPMLPIIRWWQSERDGQADGALDIRYKF